MFCAFFSQTILKVSLGPLKTPVTARLPCRARVAGAMAPSRTCAPCRPLSRLHGAGGGPVTQVTFPPLWGLGQARSAGGARWPAPRLTGQSPLHTLARLRLHPSPDTAAPTPGGGTSGTRGACPPSRCPIRPSKSPACSCRKAVRVQREVGRRLPGAESRPLGFSWQGPRARRRGQPPLRAAPRWPQGSAEGPPAGGRSSQLPRCGRDSGQRPQPAGGAPRRRRGRHRQAPGWAGPPQPGRLLLCTASAPHPPLQRCLSSESRAEQPDGASGVSKPDTEITSPGITSPWERTGPGSAALTPQDGDSRPAACPRWTEATPPCDRGCPVGSPTPAPGIPVRRAHRPPGPCRIGTHPSQGDAGWGPVGPRACGPGP